MTYKMLCYVLFQGMTFYITPGVSPPVFDLTNVVESAGGKVVKRRIAAKSIASHKDDKVCHIKGGDGVSMLFGWIVINFASVIFHAGHMEELIELSAHRLTGHL